MSLSIRADISLKDIPDISAARGPDDCSTTLTFRKLKPGTAIIFCSSVPQDVYNHVIQCYQLFDVMADLGWWKWSGRFLFSLTRHTPQKTTSLTPSRST
jgi:hypothetical protein